jgi:hypothetical protein
MVCEKLAAIDEEVDKLGQSKVYERLDGIESEFGSMVGGLNDIIDGRRKREYTDTLREKHPEFGRYEGIGKRFGMDVVGIAADNTFGLPDEEREGAIGQMLEELKGKFDDLVAALETHNQHEAAETPAQEAAEHGKPPEEGGTVVVAEEDGEPDNELKRMAKQFQGRKAG